MAAKPCVWPNCGGSRNAGIHSRWHPEYHKYLDKTDTSLKGQREGVRNYREQSGYNAEAKAVRGTPCQVVSPECSGTAEHLHEPASRGRFGGLAKAVEVGGTVPCCDNCNSYIATNPVWAAEHGWSFSNTIEGRAAASEAKAAREDAIVGGVRVTLFNGAALPSEERVRQLLDEAEAKAARESSLAADHLAQVEPGHTETAGAPITRPSRRRSRLNPS